VDPSAGGPGEDGSGGDGGDDGSAGDEAVPETVSAPGPQLPPAVEDPVDAPGDEAAEY
jgi:hypothetical protein